MFTYVVTGALITPTTRNNTHSFREEVQADSHEDAFRQVHATLLADTDPDGGGSIFNFYVNTTGDRWYGWEPADEDDLGWGTR